MNFFVFNELVRKKKRVAITGFLSFQKSVSNNHSYCWTDFRLSEEEVTSFYCRGNLRA
ncbi:MAG: hypothetical protein QXJ72_04775 [Thermoproteota archaeon]